MMTRYLYTHRFTLARRVVQILIMTSYFGANAYGWQIVIGNFSSALYFGTIPLSDPYATLQSFFAGAVIATDILIGVGVVLFMYGVIGGRFFCSWACPVNIITESAAWLREKLPLPAKGNGPVLSRHIRYWIIAISLLLSYLFSVAAFEMISPIAITHRGIIFGFGFGWIFLIAIFLFDLFSQEHGWCGHLCPLGGFNAIVGKFSLVKVVHNVDRCINAQACLKTCPEVEVLDMIGKESRSVTQMECIKCGRCVEACPSEALTFSLVSMTKQIRGEA